MITPSDDQDIIITTEGQAYTTIPAWFFPQQPIYLTVPRLTLRQRILQEINVHTHPFVFGFIAGNTFGVLTIVALTSLGLK